MLRFILLNSSLFFALVLTTTTQAQIPTGSVTVALSCRVNPETVAITNHSSSALTLVSLTSINNPGADEPLSLSNVQLQVGSIATYFSGTAAVQGPNTLTMQEIFDDNDPQEGVRISTHTSTTVITLMLLCNEGSRTFVFDSITTPTPGPATTPTPTGSTSTRSIATASVREGPSADYPEIGLLRSGQDVEIVGRNSDATWLQIFYPPRSELRAWVPASALNVTNVNVSGLPVISPSPSRTRVPGESPLPTFIPPGTGDAGFADKRADYAVVPPALRRSLGRTANQASGREGPGI